MRVESYVHEVCAREREPIAEVWALHLWGDVHLPGSAIVNAATFVSSFTRRVLISIDAWAQHAPFSSTEAMFGFHWFLVAPGAGLTCVARPLYISV